VKLVDRWRIHPVQEDVDPRKVADIAAIFLAGGWTGRPLLVEELDGGGAYQAWTGSHRLAAAREAGIDDIPTEGVNTERLASGGWERVGDPPTFFALAGDDLQRTALLQDVGDSAGAALMAEEIRARRR
jgi:hypothetical protein